MKRDRRLLKNIAIAVILSVAAVPIGSISVGAVNYNIIRITNQNNPYSFGGSQCLINNNGQIVSFGFDWYGKFISLYSDGITKYISNNFFVGDPKINDKGQIVWAAYNYDDPSTPCCIYLYINGNTTIINGSNIQSPLFPGKINNKGQIVWSGREGVYLYSNGVTTRIYNCINYETAYSPTINDNEQVVWLRNNGANNVGVYLYNNGITVNIFNSSNMNTNGLSPQINIYGQIVWSDSSGNVYLYDNGTTTKISNDETNGYCVQINDSGQIIWKGLDNGPNRDVIYLYNNGVTTKIPCASNTWGVQPPQINKFGQIVWYANSYEKVRVYIYSNGTINEINSVNCDFFYRPVINDIGQIGLVGGITDSDGNTTYDIYLATPKVEVENFIFPVLGISQSDPLKNKNDPLQDGWAGKGVGQVSATVGHLGQDYYLKIGDSADKPVYAIAKGEVVEVMNGPGKYGWCDDSDHGWGPVVVIKHTSDNGFKVSDNAIIALGNCGTDRNPKVIYSLYGHLSKDSIKDISIGQTLNTGDLIGVIGKYGVDQASWTTNHLHFEIKDEVGFLEGGWYISHPGQCPGTAAQSCGAQGIGTGYSHLANFAPHRYIPSVFIIENQGRKAHIPGVINLLMSD